MADTLSDNPSSLSDALQDSVHEHRSAHIVQAQQKRPKARNRKQNERANPLLDGTVSDGAVTNSHTTPRSKKGPKPGRSPATVAVPVEPNGNTLIEHASRSRPVSISGGHMATPGKEQAYAGAGFQASPAAASLPVPKFYGYGKSSASQPSLQARLAGEKTVESASSSPESDAMNAVPTSIERQRSPLDIFFNAHRAEQKTDRSSSNVASPLSSNRRVHSAQSENISPASERPFYFSELNNSRTIKSQAQATSSRQPESQRINVASVNESKDQMQAQTDSLKKILFDTAGTVTTTPPLIRSKSSSQTPDSVSGTPSPFQRQDRGPWTPQHSADQQTTYSPYYGNKNLSPLFKGLRTETPSKPSHLRQEVSNGRAYNTDSAIDITPDQFKAQHDNSRDRARAYLDQQIRASAPAEMPSLPFSSRSGGTSYGSHPFSPNGTARHGVPDLTPSTSISSSATNDSRDYQLMEEELRRALKLT